MTAREVQSQAAEPAEAATSTGNNQAASTENPDAAHQHKEVKTKTPEANTTTDTTAIGQAAARAGGLYGIIASVLACVLLISNIVAVKPISFGEIPLPGMPLPLVFDGGVFLFPLAYVLGDVLTEVYGLKAARRVIFTSFAMALLASLIILLVQVVPGANGWENQAAFEAVLGFVPRIVAASLAAFLGGQLMNAWVVERMRRRDGARLLRTRLVLSTVAGELVDTIIFCTVAFAGVLTGIDFIMYIVLGYVSKTLVEVVLLPITTRIIAVVKRVEAR